MRQTLHENSVGRTRRPPCANPRARIEDTHGACLADLGRYPEAEAELLDGFATLRDVFGPADHRTL